jgi:nucleotide-binding universal stress UspA family protein
MTRHILVPLDGSTFAEATLGVARAIAREPDTTIHLVHAQQPPVVIGPLSGMTEDTRPPSDMTEQLQAYLAGVAAGLAPLDARTYVRTGEVGRVVADYAASENIDLIVVSTHGRGGMGRAWLGSGTEAIILQAPVPVLVHHPVADETPPAVAAPAEVLVAVDRSEFSLQVLGPAEHLARALGATLVLATVAEPILIHARVIGSPVIDIDQEETDRRIAKGEAFVEEVAATLSVRGVPVRTRVLVDEQPARAILAEAERMGAVAIAMTTHGRRAVSRLLFGSVTDKVVRATRRDVLVVRGER